MFFHSDFRKSQDHQSLTSNPRAEIIIAVLNTAVFKFSDWVYRRFSEGSMKSFEYTDKWAHS